MHIGIPYFSQSQLLSTLYFVNECVILVLSIQRGGIMKTLFIILLALILVFLMLVYVFALAITSDDLETDMKIEKEIWDNYEKNKKNIF